MKLNKLILIILITLFSISILNSEFDITSSEQIFYSVSLSGAVNNPGVFTVAPSTRVSSILKISNAEYLEANKYIREPTIIEEELHVFRKKFEDYYPKDIEEKDELFAGSLRNIILKRGEKEIKIDLKRFFILGEDKNNPYIMDGDVIFVPAKKGVVTISGAVNQEGDLEITESDRISDIIALSLGTRPDAKLDAIEIIRFLDDLETEKIVINFNEVLKNSECTDNIQIQYDDRIFVRSIPEYHKQMSVTVLGEVQFPGVYPIEEGNTTLLKILQLSGNPTVKADLYNAFVQRQKGIGELDPEFERLKTMSANNMSKVEYAYFKNAVRELKGKYSTDIAALLNGEIDVNDFYLQDGDYIVIPQKSSFINVTGQVVEPGFVAYSKGKPYSYYIEQAGGLDWNARKSKVRLIRANTGKWTKPTSETIIMEGDILFVPEKPEFDTWQFSLDALKILSSIASIFYVFNNIYGTP